MFDDLEIREVHFPRDGQKKITFAVASVQGNEDVLIPWTVKRMEASQSFGNGMTIRTVKIIKRSEGTSICVTYVRELKDQAKDVNTTPQKAIEDDSLTMGILKKIQKEATKYVNRERLQGDALAEAEAEAAGGD